MNLFIVIHSHKNGETLYPIKSNVKSVEFIDQEVAKELGIDFKYGDTLTYKGGYSFDEIISYPPDNNTGIKNTFTVVGGQGSIEVLKETGEILSYSEDHDGSYDHIVKFDVDEWKRFWSEFHGYEYQFLESIDILDIGFWTVVGEYTEAEQDCRNEIINCQTCAKG